MRIATNSIKFLLLLISCLSILSAQNSEKQIFEERRSAFIKQMEPKSIAIFKGAELKSRNADEFYKFRQLSDYYYLSGFDEATSAFLLTPDGKHKYVIFYHVKSFGEELFGGKGYSAKDIMNIYGADTAYAYSEFDKKLPTYTRMKETIYFSMTEDDEFNKKITSKINSARMTSAKKLVDPKHMVGELRLFKSDYEIKQLQKAINITCKAHEEMMKAARPGINENELHGIAKYTFFKNGSPRWGFPSIISSGKNLPVLHYQANNGTTADGDLVMADMGAEYGYYSADVTRTFPVNGQFTEDQRTIYELALMATDVMIENAVQGKTVREMQNAGLEVLKSGLKELGLITDVNSFWQWRLYMMYGTAYHWLGIDTHDVGDYKFNEGGRKLEPGMVVAIEPGIYVDKQMYEQLPEIIKRFGMPINPEEIKKFMDAIKPAIEKYQGICCRIEDDVLITKDGNKNLSEHLAREADEIEELMAEKNIFSK